MTQSVLARLSEADIVSEPFPHVHKADALDADLYRELAASFPSLERVAAGREIGNNQLFARSASQVVPDASMPEVWRRFFEYHCSQEFLQSVLRYWRSALEAEYPELESLFGKPLLELSSGMRRPGKDKDAWNFAADMMLDVQFAVNSPVTQVSSVRVPHIDNPHKLYAAILYMRDPDDDSSGGDLLLYGLKTPSYRHDARLNVPEGAITPIKTIDYRPNNFFMWLNTPRSIHGVTPRSQTRFPRRYINFVAESYRLPGGRGFFEERRSIGSRVGSSIRRLAGFRDA